MYRQPSPDSMLWLLYQLTSEPVSVSVPCVVRHPATAEAAGDGGGGTAAAAVAAGGEGLRQVLRQGTKWTNRWEVDQSPQMPCVAPSEIFALLENKRDKRI